MAVNSELPANQVEFCRVGCQEDTTGLFCKLAEFEHNSTEIRVFIVKIQLLGAKSPFCGLEMGAGGSKLAIASQPR